MEINNLTVGIIRNEDPNSAKKWEIACKNIGVKYKVINIFDNDWLNVSLNSSINLFVLKPSGIFEKDKRIYDERIFILNKILEKPIYPSFEECYIYENKKLLRDYLNACDIPSPKTDVFFNKKDALNNLENTTFPIVAKTSIGASGSGVMIINSKKELFKYVSRAFSKKGIKKKIGPNRAVGNPKSWLVKSIKSPKLLVKKLKKYFQLYSSGEGGYVILQEFIPHSYEWRVVRIGESYFAHKKTIYKGKASGSKSIEYVTPPKELLDFVRNICESRKFYFMAIDIFEPEKGKYLVNELQTIFGHAQEYICKVNDEIGRYLYEGNKWIFEPGNFNTNESYDLRLETAIRLYNNRQVNQL